jgi:hypothetical protein
MVHGVQQLAAEAARSSVPRDHQARINPHLVAI